MSANKDGAVPEAAQVIFDEILKCRKVALAGHPSPDLDCWGSEVALARMLSDRGVECRIANADPLIARYDILDHRGMRADLRANENTLDVDALIALDTATWKRLGRVTQVLPEGCPVYNMDHHVSNERYGKRHYIPDDKAATCEILAELFHGMGWETDRETARALYAGILTDTGCFVFRNTTPSTMQTVARLMAHDLDREAIYRAAYLNKTPAELALESRCMANLRTELDGRLAVTHTTLEDYAATGVGLEATNEFPNIPRSLKGVALGLYFYEVRPGVTKVSTRAVDPRMDCAALCAEFGGGGHKGAAGALFTGDAAAAQAAMLPRARAYVENLKP